MYSQSKGEEGASDEGEEPMRDEEEEDELAELEEEFAEKESEASDYFLSDTRNDVGLFYLFIVRFAGWITAILFLFMVPFA